MHGLGLIPMKDALCRDLNFNDETSRSYCAAEDEGKYAMVLSNRRNCLLLPISWAILLFIQEPLSKMSTLCIKTSDGLMQTISKMGLRPDICGQEEALHRFQLMQVSIAPD